MIIKEKIPKKIEILIKAIININNKKFIKESKFAVNKLSDSEIFNYVEEMKKDLDLISKDNSIYFTFTYDELYTPLFVFEEKELIDLYTKEGKKIFYENLSLEISKISKFY